LNKVLFCDLVRQSLSPGELTDFNAVAAFDRVIASLSIAMCERVRLLRIAGHFMYLLLHHMKFHLITGIGKSSTSYMNNDNDIIGQGVLQGSSSAAPIFLLNSEVSLCAYHKIGIGASFCHPVDGSTNHTIPDQNMTPPLLIPTATENAQKWADLMWMSGGNLNLEKCFFYAFQPSINFKSNTIQHSKISSESGISITNAANGDIITLHSLSPNDSHRTLGAFLSPDGSGKSQ